MLIHFLHLKIDNFVLKTDIFQRKRWDKEGQASMRIALLIIAAEVE